MNEPERAAPDAVHADLLAGEAVVVDVRDAAAWGEGHVPGALHIPVDELAGRLGELPDGARIVTTCGGGTRAARAATVLRDAGRDAAVLQGGMRAWREAGLPTAHD